LCFLTRALCTKDKGLRILLCLGYYYEVNKLKNVDSLQKFFRPKVESRTAFPSFSKTNWGIRWK